MSEVVATANRRLALVERIIKPFAENVRILSPETARWLDRVELCMTRLEQEIESNAPDIMIINEMRMIDERLVLMFRANEGNFNPPSEDLPAMKIEGINNPDFAFWPVSE